MHEILKSGRGIRLRSVNLAALTCTCLLLCAGDAQPQPAPAAAEPALAWSLLREGHARFLSGELLHPRQNAQRVAETKAGQHPFATVLSCSDSRVPLEDIFDQGIGDLFVVRVAGNVCETNEIGSIEYGAAHLGTRVVLVLGHSGCGAVSAVCTDAHTEGSIPALLDSIEPAAERARSRSGLDGAAVIPLAVEENVWQSIHDLLTGSAVIRELVAAGSLEVQGAVYHIESGELQWLGVHPQQAQLLEARQAAPGQS